MNKPEINQITANSYEELLNKVKSYANSGENWKLLEYYRIVPCRGVSEKDLYEKGIIIGNGRAKIAISVKGKEVTEFSGSRPQRDFPQIFPNSGFWKITWEIHEELTGKETQWEGKKIILLRHLEAWSVADIFKIIADHYQENKSEIAESIASLGLETSFKHWVRVSSKNDYILINLGKRDAESFDRNGGGDLEIVVNRQNLERYSTTYSDGRGKVQWKDLTNEQLAKELWEMRIEPFWYLLKGGKKEGAFSAYEDHQVGFAPHPGWDKDFGNEDFESFCKVNDKNEENSDNEDLLLALIKQYFRKNAVKEIKLENGELVINYNNNNNNNNKISTQKLNSQEQLLKSYCEKRHKNKLTSQELGITPANNSTNNNSSQPKNKYLPYLIGGGIVAVIFVGAVILVKKSGKNSRKRN